jgi:hypothetical protein
VEGRVRVFAGNLGGLALALDHGEPERIHRRRRLVAIAGLAGSLQGYSLSLEQRRSRVQRDAKGALQRGERLLKWPCPGSWGFPRDSVPLCTGLRSADDRQSPRSLSTGSHESG